MAYIRKEVTPPTPEEIAPIIPPAAAAGCPNAKPAIPAAPLVATPTLAL